MEQKRNRLATLNHRQVAFSDVNLFCKRLKILHYGFAALIPGKNMINFENNSRICCWRATSDAAFEIVPPHDEESKPIINRS